VHPIWYLVALVGPFVMAVIAAALAVATGAPMQRSGAYTDLDAVGFTLLSTIVIVGLFEEVGWRGFALPRLQRHLDAIWAALVLGVIWAYVQQSEMSDEKEVRCNSGDKFRAASRCESGPRRRQSPR
jgi:uncharacterized protein